MKLTTNLRYRNESLHPQPHGGNEPLVYIGKLLLAFVLIWNSYLEIVSIYCTNNEYNHLSVERSMQA